MSERVERGFFFFFFFFLLLALKVRGSGYEECDFFRGTWVLDESYPLYQPPTCPFIEREFRCEANGRPDLIYTHYRWHPLACNLLRFDGRDFLEKMRGKSIMFVGDSLSRNQWQSLTCLLHSAVPNSNYTLDRVGDVSIFTFTEYSVKVMLDRNVYLVDVVKEKIGRVLKLDSIEGSKLWQGIDMLIFNTWHWWYRRGPTQPWDYIQLGNKILKDMDRMNAFEEALKTRLKLRKSVLASEALNSTHILTPMAVVAQTPDIAGERQSGQDVRTQNVVACQAVANIVKSSLGPVGLDKMLVDDIGDVTITNDGATILKMLEVEHPAAKVLVELAELQDREVGDGTTSVVIVAAELLKRANDLVRNKIHPTSIISGYRLAMREACKYVDEKLAVKVEKLGKDSLINCAKTSMSSKLIAGDSDFFANLVVDAVQSVKMINARGEVKYPIKGINILKSHGKSARDSFLMNGYALNTGRAAQGMPLRVSPAKIACLDFNLQKTKMQLGVQVLVTDPRELEKIRQREADMTKERIEKLLKAGANVVLTTKGIDDMALKYFVEAGAIAVRRVRKEDMRHVAKATGATMVSTFADMEGEETFEPSFLGSADEVVEERISDDAVVMIKGTKTTSAVSLILRGANDHMLDEMDRALHDALSIVKRTLESNTVVAGGGAVEAALSVYLEYLATTLGSREQLAIAEFAESLLVIPKVLSVNAAKDATELVAKLRAYHHSAQTKADKKHLSSMGLDLHEGKIRNNLEAGVIEPAMSKVKIIQFATEAAITILRIDDMIRLVKEESQNED